MSMTRAEGKRLAMAYYEKLADLPDILPSWELAAWSAWEAENVDGGREVGSGDWPGLDKYRPYLEVPPQQHGGRRRAIPEKLRYEVLGRDDYKCVHCGSNQGLTIDHIKPVLHGGGNEADNLQTLCKPCNSRKGPR